MSFFFTKPTADPLSLSTPVMVIDAETGVVPGTDNAAITSLTNQAASGGAGTAGQYTSGVKYRGINRAGPEFGNDWAGWNGQSFFDIPTSITWGNELAYLAGKGFNCIRIPFSWERAQHSLNGALNTTYWGAYTAMVNQATTAGFRVVIDCHNYGRYATGAFTTDQGTTRTTTYVQQQIGDGTLTFAHVCDLWTKVATTFASYSANLIDYNLMNECHDLAMTSTTFFAGFQTVINAIRAVDSVHMIIVPNTRSSDIDHWSKYSPGDIVLGAGNGGPLDSVAALAITDSANNYAFDMHVYYETSVGQWSTDLTNVTNWATTNNKRLCATEIGISNANASGSSLVSTFLSSLNTNSSVWFSWNEWNLPPQNITTSGNYLTDGTAMAWYTPFLTANIVTSSGGGAGLPLVAFSGSSPLWKPADEKAGRLHSLSFTQSGTQKFFFQNAVGLPAGSSHFATFKHTATDAVAAEFVNAPMTLFGYNTAPQVWSAGFSAGIGRYTYGSPSVIVGGGAASSVPSSPQSPVNKDQRTAMNSGVIPYWIWVPTAYDSTHNTPMKLFVWLHGCGGNSIYDVVDTASIQTSQTYITMAPGGAEGKCWFQDFDYATQKAKIMGAIAHLQTKFNISPTQIFIGGYSSGGDIGYPILFENSSMFAGGLFTNTSPRGDGSGINGIQAGKDATTKGHIYHVSHTGDGTDAGAYLPAAVTADMATLTTAGWTATNLERSSSVQFPTYNTPHYKSSTGDSNADRTIVGTTNYDIQTYLLPHINDGWTSPVVGGTSSGGFVNYDSIATALNDGKNHTICWTHSTSGTLKVYVDGVLNNSWSGVTYNTGALLNIIGSGYNNTDSYDGSIAEAYSYNGVLTDQNIRDLHSRATFKWF